MSLKMMPALLVLAVASLSLLGGCGKSMTEQEAVDHVIVQMEDAIAKLKQEFSDKDADFDIVEGLKYRAKMLEAARDALRSVKVSQCPADFQAAWEEYLKSTEQLHDLLKGLLKGLPKDGDAASLEKWMDANYEKRMDTMNEKGMAIAVAIDKAGQKVGEVGEKYSPGFAKRLRFRNID